MFDRSVAPNGALRSRGRRRGRTRLAVKFCLGALGLIGTAESRGQAVPPTDPIEILNLAEEAQRAQFQAVKTLGATGRFRQEGADLKTQEHGVIAEGQLILAVDGPRYFVELTFDRDQLELTRRVIVHDGSVLATNRFSPRISRTGSETDIYQPESAGANTVPATRAGLPFDPSRLSYALTDLEAHRRNVGDKKFRLEPTPPDDARLVLSHPLGTQSQARLTINPEHGYLLEAVWAGTEGSPYFQRTTADWREIDGVWCVVKLRHEVHYEGLHEVTELEFDDVQPNAPVDPKLFTLAALEMPPGTRVIDRRLPDPREGGIHFAPATDEDVDQKVASMADALKHLSSLPVPVGGVPLDQQPGRSTFAIIMAINLGLLGLFLGVIVWRRRRR
jgi:hypothetical protein